jgi:hypothetical protein
MRLVRNTSALESKLTIVFSTVQRSRNNIHIFSFHSVYLKLPLEVPLIMWPMSHGPASAPAEP